MRSASTLDPVQARSILDDACYKANISPEKVTFLRIFQSAICLVEPAGIIVRICKPGTTGDLAARELRVATWLGQAGIPAIQPAQVPHNPNYSAGHHVSFWEYIPSITPVKELYSALGDIITRIHSLSLPSFELPTFNPFHSIKNRLLQSVGIEIRYLKFLTTLTEELQQDPVCSAVLGQRKPIHGDAHIGNLISGTDSVYICYFEGFSLGHPLWDYAPAAVAVDRFSLPLTTFQKMATAEFTDPDYWQTITWVKRVRELSMTTWLMASIRNDEKLAREFYHRVDTLRNGDCFAPWKAH